LSKKEEKEGEVEGEKKMTPYLLRSLQGILTYGDIFAHFLDSLGSTKFQIYSLFTKRLYE
jgi:hypothetical protein